MADLTQTEANDALIAVDQSIHVSMQTLQSVYSLQIELNLYHVIRICYY